jgi:ferredoxin
MELEHKIVYFSPAGTTRAVADFLATTLRQRGCQVSMVDLGAGGTQNPSADWPQRCCLWVGSPVYCDHAVPLVEEFINRLPTDGGSFSVPFATWGGVTSGLTLLELAEQLSARGYTPLGAAKVLAQHSCLWLAEHPLGGGHPQTEDFSKLQSLVTAVLAKLAAGGSSPLPVAELDYLSARLRASSAQKSLAAIKAAVPPRQVDIPLCSSCGKCVAACPVAAITMENYPVISSACILCLMCVRTCPQGAYPFDAAATEARIVAMAQSSDEAKETQVFF